MSTPGYGSMPHYWDAADQAFADWLEEHPDVVLVEVQREPGSLFPTVVRSPACSDCGHATASHSGSFAEQCTECPAARGSAMCRPPVLTSVPLATACTVLFAVVAYWPVMTR